MSETINSNLKLISWTPVLDTNAYASGDQLGAITAVPLVVDNSSGKTIIQSLTIIDKAKQASILQVLLFNDLPTITSADNAVLDISDAEMATKCVGVISVVAADYFTLNANSVASIRNLNMIVGATKSATNPTGKSLWAMVRCGGSPTYAASDLVFTLGVTQG